MYFSSEGLSQGYIFDKTPKNLHFGAKIASVFGKCVLKREYLGRNSSKSCKNGFMIRTFFLAKGIRSKTGAAHPRQKLIFRSIPPQSRDVVGQSLGCPGLAFRRGTVKQSHDYKFGILENYHCCRVGDFTALASWCRVSKLEDKFCSALEFTWACFKVVSFRVFIFCSKIPKCDCVPVVCASAPWFITIKNDAWIHAQTVAW